jgi:hypothetical protein
VAASKAPHLPCFDPRRVTRTRWGRCRRGSACQGSRTCGSAWTARGAPVRPPPARASASSVARIPSGTIRCGAGPCCRTRPTGCSRLLGACTTWSLVQRSMSQQYQCGSSSPQAKGARSAYREPYSSASSSGSPAGVGRRISLGPPGAMPASAKVIVVSLVETHRLGLCARPHLLADQVDYGVFQPQRRVGGQVGEALGDRRRRGAWGAGPAEVGQDLAAFHCAGEQGTRLRRGRVLADFL